LKKKQAEEKAMNHGDKASEISGARRSQRRDENREASAGRADHGRRRGCDTVFYLDVRGDS
jgi:hypothetical protein